MLDGEREVAWFWLLHAILLTIFVASLVQLRKDYPNTYHNPKIPINFLSTAKPKFNTCSGSILASSRVLKYFPVGSPQARMPKKEKNN